MEKASYSAIKTLATFAGVALLLAISALADPAKSGGLQQAAQDMAALTNATWILVTECPTSSGRTNRMYVTGTNVTSLIQAIALKPAPVASACYGVHHLHLGFRTPSGEVKVSICRQCFDVFDSVDNDYTHRYEMPKPLYKELLKQAERYGPSVFESLRP